MQADLVVNGAIYTMDAQRPLVEAVAVQAGRVVDCGTVGAVKPLIGPRTVVLDLKGRTVIPGLIDSHVHLLMYGLALQQVDVTGVRSPEEAAQRVLAQAKARPAGEWILGRGWDRNLWPSPAFPRRETLDAVAPEHPVALSSKDAHALWLNGAALRRVGFSAAEAEQWGNQVVRDGQTGEPTGVLLEEAAGTAWGRIDAPGGDAMRGAAKLAAENALRLGVTGVHNCEGGSELAVLSELRQSGELDLRVYMLMASENLDAAIDLGLQTGLGDEWLRIGHLKLFADGALGSHTADMLAPYEGEPENWGIPVLDGDALRTIVERASRARIAVAIHAIGDRANRRVLDVLAETRPIWGAAGLRPRIEHVQLLSEQDVPRLAEIGVIASMQPIHATSDWQMADACWGTRTSGAYAWRSLCDAGAILAFGSDCPVETIAPLAGIHAAVMRERPDGSPQGGWHKEQRLTVQEAIRAYTLGAAYAAGEERTKGSLTPGKVGDMVILSEDIFLVEPRRIPEVEVLGTIVGGRLVYSAGL